MREEVISLRNALFNQDISAFMMQIGKIVEELNRTAVKLSENEINRYNEMLRDVLEALQRKDYLYASDIIMYDLMPMLHKEN